jgi:hypothetical protein
VFELLLSRSGFTPKSAMWHGMRQQNTAVYVVDVGVAAQCHADV